jgi:hypothetical protein
VNSCEFVLISGFCLLPSDFVLAGLRYDKDMVYRILKESDMLEESVVYQDIF